MGESKKGSRRKRKGEKKPKQKEWWKRKGAQQKNIWVTLLIKLSVKFKNPTAFYLWAWKDERSKEQKVVTFMFIHKCFEGTYLCLTTSFSTWKYKHKLSKGFEVLSYAEVPAEQGVLSWGRKVPAVLEEHECKEAEREDVPFNPLSFAYAKSLIESIGGICLGMPGKFLAWPVSIVWSLSASQLCWPQVHLVSTHLLGLEGWKWMQQEGRDQAEEALLTAPVLLCTGGNAAAIKTPELSVKVPDTATSALSGQGFIGWEILHSHRAQQVPQESSPSKKAQNTWYSMQSFQAGLSPWAISIPSLGLYCSVFDWMALLSRYSPALLWSCPTQTLSRKFYWVFNDCQHN